MENENNNNYSLSIYFNKQLMVFYVNSWCILYLAIARLYSLTARKYMTLCINIGREKPTMKKRY